MSAEHGTPGRAALAAHAASLALVFAALFAWTWGKWPDPLVDFGRELYVPWRMLEGDVLFRDIAWFNGPLSPHFNACMFSVFGAGLATLVWVNAGLFAITLALLHSIVRHAASLGAATAACATVMALCGFGQLVGIGNYNFITPYSHEATHGVLLGLVALAAAQRWGGRRSIAWVLLSGSAVGSSFLTKPEMFVAALAGAGASLALLTWSARFDWRRTFVAFALGLLTPLLLSWVGQISTLGSDGAWRATLGAWPELAGSEVAQLAFYRKGLGLDAPGENLLAALAWGAGTLALFAPSWLLAAWGRAGRRRIVAAAAATLLTAGVFALSRDALSWPHAARPWPFLMLALTLVCGAVALRHRGNARWPQAAGLAVFSLAMLLKMVLNARLIHYGFALALPAAATLVAALWCWIPRLAAPRLGDGLVVRAATATALTALCAIHLGVTARMHSHKRVELGSGRDAFLTDVRGQFVQQALDWLASYQSARTAPPTLAVFPEGVTINYLARLENPTPFVNFMPPEIVLFGEDEIRAAFEAHSPDLVLLTHKSTAEYGFPWFGRDYAQSLFQWLATHYHPVALFGDPPLGLSMPGEPPLQRAPVFGIRVFERNP